MTFPDISARIRVDTSSLDRAKDAVRDFGRSLDRSSQQANRAGSSITSALRFPALISGATLAATGVSALGAGFVALVAGAAPAAGVLASLPVALTAGAQAAGVAALAFSGVLDAVKNLGKVQAAQAQDSAAAGAAAQASARAQEAAARGVEAAQRALAKAQEGASRAAAAAARQVADARRDAAETQVEAARRVKSAEESAAETAVEAAQRVTSAQRGLVQAREAAVESVTRALEQQFRAEREVTAAQRDAERAQESLTDARRSAQERIESLTQRLAGAALDERRAVLSLEQARADLAETQADPKADDLARRSASLRVEEALQGLSDLQRSNAKLRADQEAAARAGVEGSEAVRSAQEKVADAVANVGRQRAEAATVALTTEDAQLDALESVQEAERRLAEAQRESARDVRLAQEGIDIARREGAEQVAEAQRRVTDAVREQSEQQRDSAEAVADAQRGLQDALRAVADAQTTAGAAGVSATDKLLEGYNALSPAAQRFATYLAGPAKDALQGLSDVAAASFLPQLQTALGGVVRIAPQFNGAITATGQALGRLSIATSDLVVRELPLLQTILRGNVPLLETTGQAALALAPAFLQITAAAQPMTQLLAEAGLRAAQFVAAAVDAGYESGRLAQFFEQSYTVAAQLGRILRDLAVALFNVGRGGADLGGDLLDSLERLTARFRAFTESAEGQNQIARYFEDVRPVLREVGLLLGDVAKGFGNLATSGDLAPILSQLRTDLLPVLGELFNTATAAFAPALIELGVQFARVFTALATETGPLRVMVDVLADIAEGFADVLEKHPELVTLIAALGVMKLAIAGITIVLGPLRAAWALATAAVTFFTGATTASTTATTINGVTTVAHTTTTTASRAATILATASTVAHTVAVGASTVAQGIATAATAAWTGAVTLLNVALRANPIGIVITLVAALATGLVVAYRESETFRRFVDQLWAALKTAGEWVVEFGRRLTAWFIDKAIDARNKIVDMKDRLGDFIDKMRAFRLPEWVGILIDAAKGIGDGLGSAARAVGDGLGLGAITGPGSVGPLTGADAAASQFKGQPDSVKRLMALMPAGTPLISGIRYGKAAITATGNPSYHGKGRAVDVPPSMELFNYLVTRFGRVAKELIYSPAGRRQIHNGRPHYYTGKTREDHFDHIHFAMDRGGIARGIGYMPKLTPRPERVLSPDQTVSFERLVDRLPQLMSQTGTTTDLLLRELIAATYENTAEVRRAPLAGVERTALLTRQGVL